MRERFAELLDGFSALADRPLVSRSTITSRIRNVLEGFCECRRRVDSASQKQAGHDREHFGILLDGYNEAEQRYRQGQEQVADDFNLLEVMHLTGREVRHSMVLAWLLDHDMRKLGTHAQGDLGFRLFLNEFNLPTDYANCKYWVRREVAGDESIVDVEVACRDRFLIHIENKIWASEGNDQTDREWNDLQRKAANLNVGGSNVHALFLTPDGKKAASSYFRAIRWGRIVSVLDKFAEQAKPEDVKLFARHYARALRRFIVVPDTTESKHSEGTVE